MQRVIDRKLYDTETAEEIARYAPNVDTSDFNYLVETLYRTSNGSYFLHGEGGAQTEYARSTRNGKTSGAEIKPLDEEEALDWCEDRSIAGETVVDEFDHLIDTA